MKAIALGWLLLLCPIMASAAFPDHTAFARAIMSTAEEIPELQALADLAKKHKAKAHLFGGTAASLAQFVKQREDAKDHPGRYLEPRLTPTFENAFPGAKDIDVVIDGPPEAVAAIRTEMEARFPRSLPDGKKSAWEFRPLRYAEGPKAALLNDADFMAQHNDSLSTSLIALGETPEQSVMNLLEPLGKNRWALLESLRTGRLDYYFSPHHNRTTRFVNGLNPPILSAVRALSKTLEYDLQLSPESEARLREVVGEFRPSQLVGYPRKWLEQNGPKLVQNSADVERSFRLLKEMGFWQKLSQIGSAAEPGSLAWWLSKDPLPRKPLGQAGKTAQSLGLSTVAHSTSDYRAFQVMSLSPAGKPNVFMSRDGAVGERAVHGSGFYVAKGEVGAWKNPYSLVYDVDPNARLDEDFVFATNENGQEWYRVLNESALRRRQASSHIPLEEKVKILIGITEGGGNLPPQEFFEAQRGQIINEVRGLSLDKKVALERALLKSFPGTKDVKLLELFEAAGLSPSGEATLIDFLLASTKKDAVHESISGRIHEITKHLTPAQRHQATQILTDREKSGWTSQIYGVLPKLEPAQRAEVTAHLSEKYLDRFLALPANKIHGSQVGYGLMSILPYVDLDQDKLRLVEERLWDLMKKKTSDQWVELVATEKSGVILEGLRGKLPEIAQALSGNLPGSVSKAIRQRGSPELRRELAESLGALVQNMARQGGAREEILRLALDLEEEGFPLPITVKDRYALLRNLHQNFDGRIAEQGWGTDAGGFSHKRNVYAQLADSIERIEPSLAERREGAEIFLLWSKYLDLKNSPGLSTGRAFRRTFEALPLAERAPYRDWVHRAVGQALANRRPDWTISRFEGDYSLQRNVAELLHESPITAGPDAVPLMARLDQTNTVNSGNAILHKPEAGVYHLLDQIAARDGADGLIQAMEKLDGLWTIYGKPSTFTLAFADRILLSPEWADRPDLLNAFLRAQGKIRYDAETQATMDAKLKDLAAQPHWQLNQAPAVPNCPQDFAKIH